MKKILLTFYLLLSISVFSQEEKRLALVIGNANYDKGELKNPVNDARLIASTLKSLDFDVILKENLSTKREMTETIREFGEKRSKYDVAFVYYAGHGIQVGDENFLLPTKEIFKKEYDVMDYGVSVQNIMRYLKSQTNEVNILILDACRDNPFESNWNKTRSLKGGGLAKIPPPTGSLIAFSTDSGQTAPDGDGDNSVYTTSLVKNISIENISIDQVFRNVRAEVLFKTEGIQRPVEATQLVGKSFIINKTFSIYESSLAEIINFSNSKVLNNEFDQAIEVLNSAADFFKSKNQLKEEVLLRKKLIETYAFNKLEDGLPKYFSLHIRNLDYSKITKADFLKHFKKDELNVFIKNLFEIIKIDDKKYINNSDKAYFISLYKALNVTYQVININYFFLEDFIIIPNLILNDFNFKSDGLSSFWEAKTLHLEFRLNPYKQNKYLINNHEDLNKIIEEKFKFIINQMDNNIEIIKTKQNSKLIDFTLIQYPNIKKEIERMIADMIGFISTKNNLENLEILTTSFINYKDFFLKKDFSLENYIDFTDFFWYQNGLQSKISGYIFYSSTLNEDIYEYLKLYEITSEYINFLNNIVENIIFENKPMIKKYNSFVKNSRLRTNSFLQLQNYFLSDESEKTFNDSKKNILTLYNDYKYNYDYFLTTIEKIKNNDYKFLENKNLFNDWPLFNNHLLYKSYLGFLKNSSFSNKSNSGLKQKMIEYEKEYKLNFINQVWVLKYLNSVKTFDNNTELFFNLDFLLSLKLFEELIETDFGTRDDILFLNYADLHIKLLVSSNSNFCFNPFSLKERLNFLINENKDSQNFLLNAYLDELSDFFQKNSSFYLNLLNHYNEEDLKNLFNN